MYVCWLTPFAHAPAGLEAARVGAASGFINIGERCNVAGSRLFCKMIRDNEYNKALDVVKKQVCMFVCMCVVRV